MSQNEVLKLAGAAAQGRLIDALSITDNSGVRQCIFVRAYNLFKPYGDENSLGNGYIRPRDWDLDGISSWGNDFLGKDHRRKACE